MAEDTGCYPAATRLVVHEAAQPDQAGDPASDSAPPAPLPAAQLTEPEEVPLPQGAPANSQPGTAEASTLPSGEPLITLRVDNVDVGKVMEMVSRQAKILNILVSPGVSGKITVDLRDKTVDETLRIIAKQCRLTVRRERDVIYISTLAEFRQIEEDDLPVRVYHLNYVKSKDVETMIKPLLSKKGMFTTSPESETGLTSDVSAAGTQKDVKAGGNSMAGGEIVVIQEDRKSVV